MIIKSYLPFHLLFLSRIEWVWLHWSEYLKAYEEFEMWLVSVRRSLEPEVELQLGVKEKLWQVSKHTRCWVSTIVMFSQGKRGNTTGTISVA